MSVTVLNDIAPPTVALASPVGGRDGAWRDHRGGALPADDIGVSSVQFLLDGASLGAADSRAALRSRVADGRRWPMARMP